MPMRRVGRPGLLGTVARTAVVAGTATVTANAVNRHAENKAIQRDEAAAYEQQQQAAAMAPPPPAPAPAPAAGGDDVVSRLQQLVQLKDSGVLSEEEFEKAKAQVLAG